MYQFCNGVLIYGHVTSNTILKKNTASFVIEIGQINCKAIWHMARYFFLAWKRSPVLHYWRELLRPSVLRLIHLLQQPEILFKIKLAPNGPKYLEIRKQILSRFLSFSLFFVFTEKSFGTVIYLDQLDYKESSKHREPKNLREKS